MKFKTELSQQLQEQIAKPLSETHPNLDKLNSEEHTSLFYTNYEKQIVEADAEQDLQDIVLDESNFELDGVKLELVKVYGGEGMGDKIYHYYKVVDSNEYYYVQLSYDSWDGADWYDKEFYPCFLGNIIKETFVEKTGGELSI